MADIEDNAFRLAKHMYKNRHVGKNSIVVSDLRSAVRLSPMDFEIADDHLKKMGYIAFIDDGDTGERVLLPQGIQYVASKKEPWTSKGIVMMIVGLLIAILAIVVSLMVPEFRKWLRLE